MSLDNNYFKLPNDIFDLNLKASEFQVLTLLIRYQNNKRNCYPSYADIAVKCNMSRRNVIDCISKLENKGIISKTIRPSKHNDNDSNMYVVKILHHPSAKSAPNKELLRNSKLKNSNHSGFSNVGKTAATNNNLTNKEQAKQYQDSSRMPLGVCRQRHTTNNDLTNTDVVQNLHHPKQPDELTIETNEDLKSWLNRYCRFTYGKDFIDNGKDIDTTYSLITKVDLCTLLRKSINNYESFTIDKLNEMACNQY